MKIALAVVGGVALLIIAALAIGIMLFYKGLSTPGSSVQQAFDKSFRQSCEAEAGKKVSDQELVRKYCDCTLAKFKETKSMNQAVTACAAQFR